MDNLDADSLPPVGHVVRKCGRSGCNELIPETAHANRRYCASKDCQNWRKREASRSAYARNRTARSSKLQAYNRQNREAERRRYHSRYRIRKLARTYGITFERVVEILSITACDICGREADRMCIDHCHKTGIVRGRLCDTCNRAIGLFGDSVDRLRNAITYIERSQE